jgi:hypothetical protein
LFLQNSAILFDLRNGNTFKKLDFSCKYAWYDGETDSLYLQQTDGIYLWGAGQAGTYIYVSGYIGVPEAEHTYFREVVVSSEGAANITLIVDGKSVFSVAVKKSGRHRIQPPYNTLGTYAQIKISGTGTLKEAGVLYG